MFLRRRLAEKRLAKAVGKMRLAKSRWQPESNPVILMHYAKP
jgi:hypothetical protein